MTRLGMAFTSLLLFVLAGCAAAPRPMKYVATGMPSAFPSSLSGSTRTVKVEHTRILPNIRLPRDAAAFLNELEQAANTPVLQDADLRLTTSICLLICVNTDSATARVSTGE